MVDSLLALNTSPSGGGSGGSVTVTASALPTGAATEATLASVDAKLPALSGGSVPVTVTASALPAGAATEATLAAISANTPALGQATMAASTPVVIASDQSAVTTTTPAMVSFSYTQAGAIPINTDLLVIDCAALRGLSIQYVSAGTSGVITPAWSNDGVTYANATITTQAGAAITTFNAAQVMTTNVCARYFRLRLTTAATAGTTTLAVTGFQQPISVIPTQPISGSITLGTGSGLAADIGIQNRANATGAASTVSVLSPATATTATIKASTGRLLGWQLLNSAAAFRSVKIFNATAPTLGTTAAIFEIDIPAGASVSFNIPGGIGFATAMTYIVTAGKGLTNNDSTGLVANDVSGSFFFA